MPTKPIQARLAAWPLLVVLLGGCGSSTPPPPMTPTADARAALVEALDVWKGGGRPGSIPGPVPVFAVDTVWQGGQKLAGYEVLGDEPTEGTHAFDVRLALARPDRREEVRYLVFGRSPVNVMREDDFRRNASMEDAPRLPPRRR